jgi:hypothetical protein
MNPGCRISYKKFFTQDGKILSGINLNLIGFGDFSDSKFKKLENINLETNKIEKLDLSYLDKLIDLKINFNPNLQNIYVKDAIQSEKV